MKGRKSEPGFEIPDLDLPPPKPSASQARLAAVRFSESGERQRAPMVTGLSELPAGPPLDLDLNSPISSVRGSEIPAHEVTGRAGFQLDSMLPEVAGITVAPEGRANWPSGVTEERALLEFDPKQVEALARYGSPSSLGVLNVLYALRVFAQRRRLRRELLQCEAELARVESARDDLLARLAEQKREALSGNPGFQRFVHEVAEMDAQGSARAQLQNAAAQEQAAELNRLDAELSTVLPELRSAESALGELSAVQAEREQTLLRLEARHKRGFIELRAMEQRGAGVEEAEHVRAQQQALVPQLEAAKAAYEATLGELAVRAKHQREVRYRVNEIERKKRDLRARFQQRLDSKKKEFGAVEKRQHRALADLGRAVLAARGGIPLEPALLGPLRDADAAVSRALAESEMRVRALDACDRDKLATGYSWMWAIAAAIVAIVCYRSFVRAESPTLH
ncbi:MAG TPA: hypothetical protein VFQ35_02180 [Polyangiaceae bacterium]|nr:hypothetical protein [Polyangiaceae bacterium]